LKPPEEGDTVYIVGKILHVSLANHPGAQLIVTVTPNNNKKGVFYMFADDIALIEAPEDEVEVA
jgi:hypothetical protein